MQLSDRAPPPAPGFRLSTIAALFVVLMAAALIPIALHPLPPLSDYINHLARMHVIDAIGSDPDLSRFYVVQWQIIPNLMIDLIVPVLHRFMNVYLAGQIFTVLSFVLIASGALALNRALLGRWSPVPLLALPLLYNGVLLVGVMNYVFGIGLVLWGLAAWVLLRDRDWRWRFLASTIFAFTLFICHLFAAGVYAMGLLAIELHRLWCRRTEPWKVPVLDLLASGLPFIPLVLLLFISPTWNAPGSAAFWELAGKLEGLLAVVKVYYASVAAALLAISLLASAVAWRWRIISFHPVGFAILTVSFFFYLALPRALFGAHLADQRLPIAVAFILIACLDIDLRSRAARFGLLAVLVSTLAVRLTEVQVVWNHLDRGTNEFLESVKSIKRGARILVVYGDRSSGKEISDFNLVHAASLAVIERSALVSTEFTVPGKQILHAQKEFRKLVDTEDRWPPSLGYVLQVADGDKTRFPYFWNDWPHHYEYLYILFTTRGLRNPDRNHLGLVYEGTAFQLYRVIPTISVVGR
ncbi:MAG TPA: hypothetical protein VFP60_12585 [Pseudolabrys sp.]|nr:hypothetical protein [Pseudolabrys sp.]